MLQWCASCWTLHRPAARVIADDVADRTCHLGMACATGRHSVSGTMIERCGTDKYGSSDDRRLVRRRVPIDPLCHPSTHRVYIPPLSLFRLVDFRLSCRSVHMQLSRAGSNRGNRYRDHRKHEASIACRRVAAATLVTTVAILYRRPSMPPTRCQTSMAMAKADARPTRCQMPDPDTLLPQPILYWTRHCRAPVLSTVGPLLPVLGSNCQTDPACASCLSLLEHLNVNAESPTLKVCYWLVPNVVLTPIFVVLLTCLPRPWLYESLIGC